jgi:hypothetical protein
MTMEQFLEKLSRDIQETWTAQDRADARIELQKAFGQPRPFTEFDVVLLRQMGIRP